MKIPKSYDELPQAFFENNQNLFKDLLSNPVHGDCRTIDFFGTTACRTEIIPPDAKICGAEMMVLKHAKPSVRFTFWCSDRTNFGFVKLSQLADDRIVEAHYLEDDDVFELQGMARRRYLKSDFGSRFMQALSDAKSKQETSSSSGTTDLFRLSI